MLIYLEQLLTAAFQYLVRPQIGDAGAKSGIDAFKSGFGGLRIPLWEVKKLTRRGSTSPRRMAWQWFCLKLFDLGALLQVQVCCRIQGMHNATRGMST